MEPTYNWKVDRVIAKKSFTDKNNILREKVIHNIALSYVGVKEIDKVNKKENKQTVVVSLNLTDLSQFKPINEFSTEDFLTIALNSLEPKRKESIENMVKSFFTKDKEDENSLIIIVEDIKVPESTVTAE